MKSLLLTVSLLSVLPLQSTFASQRVVDRIVLVHGFLGRSSQMNPVKKRLEKLGFECYAPSLKPSDGRLGLEQLADQLKEDIDSEFGALEPFIIISYSMGGLVSRYYLQNLGGADRCAALITISSPHHGSNAAWFYPSKGAVQMRPGSQFLADLQATESKLGEMPVVSYRTPLDLMILPSKSSIWERAENRHYVVSMHPMMLRSNKVLTDIEHRLLLGEED
ncbi:hypothetical protein JIN85_16840 [Luteolibacter pohnpeiensis]|uniref:AB hydrolase-1 domain-containing protein n=1 Tax=Luteolibacter pohnpeiensis TaxID=454153 RepID=A0A934VY20_9BACT|nr:alpha/beta fold hydrolase [Luteolibacter pohnpeiensis]MBK1884089.1 hypothetical protein [Luteolibacter pohnpeiensis]